jgi:hypothetical protein
MLTMSTASQEGPGLAKVYPGLRFFGIRISLTDCFAEPGAHLIIHSNPARRASYAAPQIIPTTALPISTFA